MGLLEILGIIFIVLFLIDLFGTGFLGSLVYLLLVVGVILLAIRFIRRAT